MEANWINVNDRLPELNDNQSASEWVIGAVPDNVMVYSMFQYHRGLGFIAYGEFNVDERITHWTPMPKPPVNS